MVLSVWPSTFPNMENEDNSTTDFPRLLGEWRDSCATWGWTRAQTLESVTYSLTDLRKTA